jgi:hypothetical protein
MVRVSLSIKGTGRSSVKGDQKIIAGIAIVAVAIGIGIYAVNSGSKGAGDVSCTLSTTGVGLVASGLARNESAGRIIAGVGATTAVGVGCKKAIESFTQAPDEPVTLKITAPNGTATEETPTGSELAQPPPPQPTAQPSLLDCFNYQGGFVIRLCLQGTIPPPSR